MAAASVKSAVSGTAGVAQPDPAHLGDSEKASATASVSGADSIDAEKQEVSPAEENPPRDVHGVRWFLVVIAILSSVFLFSLDNTVVADIQPAIVLEFDDVSKLPWLTGGFLLACLATTPIWGKLYGQLEAKWTYLFCLVLFEVGSALCGAAPNMNAMILGRVIAGLGGSGVYIGVMTLLSVTTTLEERPQYISYTGLIWGIGTVLGPIVGGAFTDSSAGWRWAFYINLVIGAVFAPVYLFFLPTHDMRPGVPFLNRFKEVDWVGAVLMIGAITAGIMAISFGGVLYAWNSGSIIACFVVSGVLFIILGFQQVYTIFTTESRRIFPIQFLKRKTMVILFAETSSASTAVGIPLYMYVTLHPRTERSKANIVSGFHSFSSSHKATRHWRLVFVSCHILP
jgi:MFS family permease